MSPEGKTDFITRLVTPEAAAPALADTSPSSEIAEASSSRIIIDQLLGPENVVLIEARVTEIKDATAQISRKNPFAGIANADPKIGEVQKAQSMLAESDGTRVRTFLLRGTNCAGLAKTQFELIASACRDLSLPDRQIEPTKPPHILTAQVREQLDELEILASSTPTSGDIALVDRLRTASNSSFEKVRHFDQINVDLLPFRNPRRRTIKLSQDVFKIEVERYQAVKKLIKNTIDWGSSKFTSTQNALIDPAKSLSLRTLTGIKKLRAELSQSPEVAASTSEENMGEILKYLNDKEAEILFAWGHDNRVIAWLNEQTSSDHTPVEQEAEVTAPDPELEKMRILITQARDISIGGGRLKIGKKKMQETADNLQRSSVELGEQGLNPTQNGIMIAILAGKFQEFVETLNVLKAETPSDLVASMERDTTRKQIHHSLRGINLPKTLTELEKALQQDLIIGHVKRTFSEGQIDKIKETIYTFLHGENRIQASAIEIQFPDMEMLDWEVLKPGEDLERFAKEIVEMVQRRSAAGANIEIDISRLKVLEQLSANWNKGETHYARGALKRRRVVQSDGQKCPDEYIVLTLDETLPSGEIVTHAIAESPIVGPHALYVLRGDLSVFHWKEIYSLDKPDARDLTARPVLHTEVSGEDMVTSMVRKVTELLGCKPEDFANYKFSSPSRNRLGRTATNGQVKIS